MSWQRATFRYGTAVPLMLAVASCTGAPTPTPVAPPAPVVATPPPPPAPPPAKPWDERALDAGAWSYDSSNRAASFVQSGVSAPLLTLACSADRRSVTLTTGIGTGALDVDLKTSAGSDRLRLADNRASLSSNDGRLDRIAFSRGRFALEASNGSSLTLPVHAEIGRVIEDCRG